MTYDPRNSDEKQIQKDATRDERKLPGVEKSLRQFLKLETGLGNSEAYRESRVWCQCGRMNSTDDEHARKCQFNRAKQFNEDKHFHSRSGGAECMPNQCIHSGMVTTEIDEVTCSECLLLVRG